MSRTPRHRTGDPELDRRIDELLDRAGAGRDRDQLFEIVASAVLLAGDQADRLDLKITNAALREMREAFNMFAPYRHEPKVTIFGSARTRPDDPLYTQTVEFARRVAAEGWMVITGAGPGIMAAGMEGAGRDRSFGVLIRLPFEGGANEVIAGDEKLIEMRYFFTRKLMLVKESQGFVCLPGGFGTLDETFELLTLTQTGKSPQVPIVLLDTPDGSYWRGFMEFAEKQLAANGMIAGADLSLVRVTDDIEEAAAEILGFYRNYHSMRWVGDRLVLRLRAQPTDDELADLNERFAELSTTGAIERSGALPAEVRTGDHVDLCRLVLRFDTHRYGALRQLIDAINALPSAPGGSAPPLVSELAEE